MCLSIHMNFMLRLNNINTHNPLISKYEDHEETQIISTCNFLTWNLYIFINISSTMQLASGMANLNIIVVFLLFVILYFVLQHPFPLC